MSTPTPTQQLVNGLPALPTVTYNEKDPGSTLGQISAREQARYEQDYVPVEDTAIASLRDMSIIGDAKKRVANTNTLAVAKQRSARELARYGLRATASQSANQDVSLALDKAAGDADTLNEARLNQFDRNRGLRNQLINVGRGVADQAQQGVSEAANMQNNRENANSAAKAADKAQTTQLIGSAAAMALMVMI